MTAGHRARRHGHGRGAQGRSAVGAAPVAAVALTGLLLGGCMPGAGSDTDASGTSPGRQATTGQAPAPPTTATDQVVVSSEVGQTRASAYEDLAVLAIARVEDLWGPGAVARPVRLVLPADGAAFAALTGHAADESDVPASTVGTGPGAEVVVHPDAWDRLSTEGRQAVLTHEVTHLAMQGHGPVPGWFGEGLAEYTAHRGSALSPARIAGTALDGVRGGQVPTEWPGPGEDTGGGDGDDEGDGPDGGPWQGYALAWLACRYIAEEHSEEDLVALYRAVEGGQPWRVAVPAVLGVTDEDLLRGWQRWLTDLVG